MCYDLGYFSVRDVEVSVFLGTYCMAVDDYRIRDPAVTVIGRLRFLLLQKRNESFWFILMTVTAPHSDRDFERVSFHFVSDLVSCTVFSSVFFCIVCMSVSGNLSAMLSGEWTSEHVWRFMSSSLWRGVRTRVSIKRENLGQRWTH